MLVANVWPGGYSEISSLDSFNGYRVVSNFDFSVFEPSITLETAGKTYNFFIISTTWTPEAVAEAQQNGQADARGYPTDWPLLLPPSAGPARFVLITSPLSALSPEEKSLLDLMHRYYQANRAQLEAAARQRRIDQANAEAAEAARRAALGPLLGPPVIIRQIQFGPPSPAAPPRP